MVACLQAGGDTDESEHSEAEASGVKAIVKRVASLALGDDSQQGAPRKRPTALETRLAPQSATSATPLLDQKGDGMGIVAMEEGTGGVDADRLKPTGSASDTPIHERTPTTVHSPRCHAIHLRPGGGHADSKHLFESRDRLDEEQTNPARRGLVRNRDDPPSTRASVWAVAAHQGYEWTLGRKAQLCPALGDQPERAPGDGHRVVARGASVQACQDR